MARNIIFSGNSPEKVISREKTFTARFWKQRPFTIGEIVTASRNRRADSRFAKLKILNVFSWVPGHTDAYTLFVKSGGYTTQQIAEKEGFQNFEEFFDAYASLNSHLDPDDPERTHYFIEFKVIETLQGEKK